MDVRGLVAQAIRDQGARGSIRAVRGFTARLVYGPGTCPWSLARTYYVGT